MFSRRLFLKGSALAMVGTGTAPAWLTRAVYAAGAPARQKKILVAVFQRGAADGLNMVVPFGESRYYQLRPTIAIAQPSANSEGAALDLDGFFGLHPSLAPLKPLYDARHLAIVHATGSPDPTRSHFDAQDYMESGTPGLKATSDGWLNRALSPQNGKASPVRAVSLGPTLARSVRGKNPAVAVTHLDQFQIRNAGASNGFESMYASSMDTLLHGAGRDTFDAVGLLQSLQKQPYSPAAGANYPRGRFGDSLRQIAQLVKADVGLEVAFADIGGWDHHVNETGQLANRAGELGQSLAAFWQDLGDRGEDVILVTMSEFGRTARENGNRGTDHGHANVMFVLGGDMRGGKVYGKWPGLQAEQLYEGRDLALTTDFRDVLGEVIESHLGNRNLKNVFPGYSADRRKFPGLIAS